MSATIPGWGTASSPFEALPAVLAMRNRGLTLEQLARRMRLTAPYVKKLIRNGAPLGTAEALAAILEVPVDFFLGPQGGGVLPVKKRATACRSRGPRRRSKR